MEIVDGKNIKVSKELRDKLMDLKYKESFNSIDQLLRVKIFGEEKK